MNEILEELIPTIIGAQQAGKYPVGRVDYKAITHRAYLMASAIIRCMEQEAAERGGRLPSLTQRLLGMTGVFTLLGRQPLPPTYERALPVAQTIVRLVLGFADELGELPDEPYDPAEPDEPEDDTPPADFVYPDPPLIVDAPTWEQGWLQMPIGTEWTTDAGKQYRKTAKWAYLVLFEPLFVPPYPPKAEGFSGSDQEHWESLSVSQKWDADGHMYEKLSALTYKKTAHG